MKLNAKPKMSTPKMYYTHEGGLAVKQNVMQELERTVLNTMLWEDSFYESGETIADRIGTLTVQACKNGKHQEVMLLAMKARNDMKLRHAPLLIVCGMVAAKSPYVKQTVIAVVQRADEPGELLAMLRHNGLTGTIPRQVRLGLQEALRKFSEYDLAKYDRDSAKWKIRDVLRIVRPKPDPIYGDTFAQAELWRKAVKRELKTPDTWEVAISAAKGNAAETKATWYRLLEQKKLGGLALIRNLRNMQQAGVDKKTLQDAILAMKTDRILPFRYVAAYRAAPELMAALNVKMLEACVYLPTFKGRTVVLVDVSGSMEATLSAKSDINRRDAAATLAAIIRETCADVKIAAFDTSTYLLDNPSHGIELVGQLQINGGGTDIHQAVEAVRHLNPDRLIVITDEQATYALQKAPCPNSYILNVAPYQNGIATEGGWVRINGFSEAVPQYIAALEEFNGKAV